MNADLLAVLLSALACGVSGLAVPALVRSVPEPEPPSGTVEEDAPLEPPTDPPKEPYAAIAALPGLGWKAALVSAAAGAAVAGAVGAAWHLLVLLPLVPVGVALGLVDWRTHLLPARLVRPTYGLVIASVLLVWLVDRDTDDLVRAGWGWLILGGVYFVSWFLYPPMMGYGDVRLSGALGLALGHVGWGEPVVAYFAAAFVGSLVGVALRVRGGRRRTEYPHGPFMLIGAVVGLHLGPALTAYYGF